MTPEDIIVGQRYKSAYSADTYLGVGRRKMWTGNLRNTSEFESKHLVIIESPDSEFVGLILKEGEDCTPVFWDSISPTKR
jgi:hypothetical protein